MKFASLLPLGIGAVLSIATPVSSYAETFLFDFGNTATSGLAPDGMYWNNISSGFGSVAGNRLLNLLSSDNVTSLLTLEIVSRFNGENTNGTLDSLLDYPVSATRDSLYGNTETFGGLSNIFPSFKITGLDLTKTYDFTFFASRISATDNRETAYSVAGADSGTVFLNAANNNNNTVNLAGIVPANVGGVGEITITLSPGPNNNNTNHFTYINVMEMTVVPEPSTVVCLMGGMALLMARRRRG